MWNDNREGDFSDLNKFGTVSPGTTVFTCAPLRSCSIVLMRTWTNSILVQHCGGSDRDNLDERFRPAPDSETDDPVIDIMIVSSTPTAQQHTFAQTIQSWYPDANFNWYGYHDDSHTSPTPRIVTPAGPDEGFTLENSGRYDLVLSYIPPAGEEDQ